MNGKLVVDKETRRLRHAFGIDRKIRFLQNREKRGKGDYSREIKVLAQQREILELKSSSHIQVRQAAA
jgi:hypothetical protein